MSHGGASHHPLTGTLKELKRHWAHDLRDHGIPSAYVRTLVDRCGCQLVLKSTPVDMGETSVMKYKKSRPIEVIEKEALKVDDTLTNVQLKYHIRFRRGIVRGAHVIRYNYHHVGAPRQQCPCT